jgi:hypothetical protein
MHMKHNGASKILLLLIDGVFPIFQIPTLYSVSCCGGDNKAAALIPGAAHDHRAATERSPESADEIGCALRRAPRRPLWMAAVHMNEVGDGSPSLACFPLVFACAKKSGAPRHPFIHFSRGPYGFLCQGADWVFFPLFFSFTMCSRV